MFVCFLVCVFVSNAYSCNIKQNAVQFEESSLIMKLLYVLFRPRFVILKLCMKELALSLSLSLSVYFFLCNSVCSCK